MNPDRVAGGCVIAGRLGVTSTVAVGGLVVMCASLGACGDDRTLPSGRSWQSIHFDYRARDSDVAVCPDILGPLEEHFALLQGYLGFEWPAGRKVTYYKSVDSTDFSTNGGCGPGAGGCAHGPSVSSANALDPHELVHAYLSGSGDPPRVLVEGIAVVLACGADSYASPKPTETWDQVPTLTVTPNDQVTAYSAGAWLVGYLLDGFGPQRFLSLYGSISEGADAAAMDAAVQSIYGQPLSTIWAAALSEAQPRNNCIWQCSHPALALDGATFDTSAGICGIDAFRTFTLRAAAPISFLAKGAAFGIGPCGPFAPPRDGLNGGAAGGMLALYDLPAGSYYLEYGPAEGTITATGDASEVINPICANATDAAALDVPTVFVAVRPGNPRWFMPLRPPLADGRPPLAQSVATGTTATVCGSCDLDSCGDLSQAGPWNSGQVLNMTTDPTVPFSRFLFSWY